MRARRWTSCTRQNGSGGDVVRYSNVLVETLLERGGDGDLAEVQIEIERLANLGKVKGSAVLDITILRLRTLAARATGDDLAYEELLGRYRRLAETLGFEGHMDSGQAMPTGPT